MAKERKQGGADKKEEEMIAKANIQYTDMSLEQQAAVLQAACSSLLRLSSELKLHWRVAQATQEAIAEKYPGKWHVLVGKEFGSFVSHEAGSLMYVFFKEVGFLIFKHG